MSFEETLVTLVEEHDFTPVFKKENEDGSINEAISRMEEIGEVQRITSVYSRAGERGLFFDVALRVKIETDQTQLLEEIACVLNTKSISLPWNLGVWDIYQVGGGLTDLTHNYYWHSTEVMTERLSEWILEDFCVDTIQRMEECSLGVAQLIGEVLVANHFGFSLGIQIRIDELAALLDSEGEA